MTPEERALRDAWLAEMWPTVHEYVSPVDPRPQAYPEAEEYVEKGHREVA